jgi:endonuclease/exonuclease/phosphatase family metal-dependent hydrolase
MAVAFAPAGVFAWDAAVVLGLLGTTGRTRLVVAPLALGLAWHAAVLAPYLPGRTATAATDHRVQVLALNLDGGRADLSRLADVVESAEPDVLVLTEVTRSNAAAFARKPWSRTFPYRSGTAGSDADPATGADDARGTMVLSRHPLTDLGSAADTQASNLALRVALPGRPFALIAAHPAGPGCGVDCWLRDADAVTRLALVHNSGRLLVAGDLNATREQLTLRVLTAKAGLSDTASGSGWQPTYPADSWLPPLLAVDHVLASRQFTATDYTTVRVGGTDHLGVLASLAVD